ncbi:transposase family protein [Geothrix sp. PMB-07]|uniref:transposase family protein n=1 Tax=Geothrix sp. PMB-07 TaxID=3068640 RepID=UPI002740A937|nr:transposase family protein [Geothrix sp. PMB-07]WLT30754.1 transposase family protein [Geothrix sp. PMB-07]
MTRKRRLNPVVAIPEVAPLVVATEGESRQPKIQARQPKETSTDGDYSRTGIPSQVVAIVASPACFTVAEAAELAGVSKQAALKRLSSLGLLQDRISESGPNKGRKEKVVAYSALFGPYPDAARVLAAREKAAAALSLPPAPTIAPASDLAAISSMKSWQRQRMDARLAILRYVDHLVEESRVSRDRALNRLFGEVESGALPENLKALLPLANARSGQSGDRTLSRRTFQRWAADAKQGMDRLAPKACDRSMPAWLPQLLEIYRQPQKPSLSWAVQTLVGQLPAGALVPSYDSARRWLLKVGAVDRERGRMLPRELKTIKPFRRREKPEFPFDVLTADGHTFDAEIAHPEHGRPFRPELTMVADVATNRIVGWSAWEKESTWSVMDAFRMAVLTGGVPLIFYTDNGPGYRNERLEALKARLGYEHHFSIPYNSQARGVIEHLQKTVWVDLAAKAFATYVGASMDRQARQIVFKATRQGQPVLPSWQAFVAFVEQAVAAHNQRASKACPKALDSETGRQRRLSPDQTWAKAQELGWKPEGLPISLDEFRPEELRQVRRGEIQLFGNTYFNRELAELHGEEVCVAFDIHDASRVWVSRKDGTFICEAGFESNKAAYFPKPYVDSLREKRQEGQRQRLEQRAQRVLGDAAPEPLAIQALTPEMVAASDAQLRKLGLPEDPVGTESQTEESTGEARRPAFKSDRDYYCWILDNPDLADADETAMVQRRLRQDPLFSTLLGRDDAASA